MNEPPINTAPRSPGGNEVLARDSLSVVHDRSGELRQRHGTDEVSLPPGVLPTSVALLNSSSQAFTGANLFDSPLGTGITRNKTPSRPNHRKRQGAVMN